MPLIASLASTLLSRSPSMMMSAISAFRSSQCRHQSQHPRDPSSIATSLPRPPPSPVSSAASRTRTGRNLSQRYKVLERSLRGKEALVREIEETKLGTEAIEEETNLKKEKILEGASTFHGFHVPIKPAPPQDDECCMSGCAICVYDLYASSLEAYEESVSALRKALEKRGVERETWPESIRVHADEDGKNGKKANVVLSAFEEMERALKEKHAS